MNESEKKLNKRIRYGVATIVATFFSLILVLSVLIVVNGNLSAMERRYQATNTELQNQIQSLNDATDNFWDEQVLKNFVDEYILKVLGYGKDGSQIYIK